MDEERTRKGDGRSNAKEHESRGLAMMELSSRLGWKRCALVYIFLGAQGVELVGFSIDDECGVHSIIQHLYEYTKISFRRNLDAINVIFRSLFCTP